jgi:1,4-dihydroxy-2-naphthoate octaprenyltransferase
VAVAPVAVGTGVAAGGDSAVWWKALLALVVALALQVGVNYANDYSDGIRGTDEQRVGPLRLVGSRVAEPARVKAAAFAAFGVGGVAGLVLAASSSWWLLTIGAAAIAAAWGYTGGDRPYGYRGLGEVSVFVFFGLVAVLGTTYVQSGSLEGYAVAAALPVGMLACAVLVVNNLRDAGKDAPAGKRTLAVVLGDRVTRRFFTALLIAPFGFAVAMIPGRPWTGLALLAAPLAARALRPVRSGASGRDLIPALAATARTQLVFGLALALGLGLA